MLLTLVRTDLLEGWRQTLDEDAPNHFLINIQPHEVEQVGALFVTNNIEMPVFTPLIRARMTTINGESVKERTYPKEDGKWLANREANLSWAAQLSSSNEILQGNWWPIDYAGPPLPWRHHRQESEGAWQKEGVLPSHAVLFSVTF